MAADLAVLVGNPCLTGEPEAVGQMLLRCGRGRKQLTAGLDLYQTLAAVALLVTARRHMDADRLRQAEQRPTVLGGRRPTVDAQAAGHRRSDYRACARSRTSRLNSSTALPASAA